MKQPTALTVPVDLADFEEVARGRIAAKLMNTTSGAADKLTLQRSCSSINSITRDLIAE